jgi:hypothetical protein
MEDPKSNQVGAWVGLWGWFGILAYSPQNASDYCGYLIRDAAVQRP